MDVTNLVINNLTITKKDNKSKYLIKLINNIIENPIIYQSIFNKNISFKFDEIIENKSIPNSFYSSSSTIIRHPHFDDKYILNIRCVNYYINTNGNSSINDNKIVFTHNIVIILDKYFHIISKTKTMPQNINSKYIGIEDIRLFNFKNKIYYIGSSFDKTTNKIRITSNEYVLENNYNLNFITPTFKTNFNWEKNWVFFENNDDMFIIYKWYPLSICKINYNNNNLDLIKTINVPQEFKNFRGSTNGVLFDNKIWFIVHSQIQINNKKHYYHYFVVFNNNLSIYGYSKMFKFENYIVEYSIGMEVTYNNNFVITYSTLDSTTKLLVLLPDYINELLIYK